MKTSELSDSIFNWIDGYKPQAKHDFTSSGMPNVSLSDIDVKIDSEEFDRMRPEIETVFRETVGHLYDVEPENVYPVNGGSEAISLASLFLKNKTINVKIPEYEPVYKTPEFLGMNVKKVEKLENIEGEAIMCSNPNNPSGNLMSADEVNSLISKKNDVFMDETFQEFSFSARPHTLFSEAPEAICATTLTKFYGAGFARVGFFFISRERIRMLHDLKLFISGSKNLLSLYIAVKLLNKREKIVEKNKKRILNNRKLVEKYLEGIDHTDPGRTTFTFVNGFDVDFADRIRKKYGILVTPGKYFGLKEGFRVCFTQEESKLEEDLQALVHAIQSEGRR
ncbi:pyridoxal phosphate-dependent aminotransferase [Caldiplasma sukawensis]